MDPGGWDLLPCPACVRAHCALLSPFFIRDPAKHATLLSLRTKSTALLSAAVAHRRLVRARRFEAVRWIDQDIKRIKSMAKHLSSGGRPVRLYYA